MLENKSAVIYGGGGAVGGAIARAFAREGARVYVVGRTLASLDAVARDIRAAGGTIETAVVDAPSTQADVDGHLDTVIADAGRIDISYNVISRGDVQGTPLIDMSIEDFEAPITNGLRTQFITARAAARRMITQGSGVILMFGGTGDVIPCRRTCWAASRSTWAAHRLPSVRSTSSDVSSPWSWGRTASEC